MTSNLLAELDALKWTAVRNQEARKSYPTIAELFVRLLGRVIEEQRNDGWVTTSEVFAVLANAHMLRVLTDMGVRLDDQWHIAAGDGGNLARIVDQLVQHFDDVNTNQQSFWGEDFWDDCYVMLALLKVRKDFLPHQKEFFNSHVKKIINHLGEQADSNFAKVEKGKWFGPGLHTAGIVLFDALVDYRLLKENKAQPRLKKLVEGLIEQLEDYTPWMEYYGWHSGQVITAFNKLQHKRKEELGVLGPHVAKLYQDTLSRQDPKSGAWSGGGMSTVPEYVVYSTVRVLSALYTTKPRNQLAIGRTHEFLLHAEQHDPPFFTLKGSINLLEVLQDVFEFSLPYRDVGLLINIGERLRRFELDDMLLGALPRSEVDTLRHLQHRVRKQLEERGESALEPMGVNGRVFDELCSKDTFLAEFDDEDTRDGLQRFLSATMTESRATAARPLIKSLWTRSGYFNFVPLFERLSDLEYEGKFFDKYRDHTNHQLLVFLLGSYIYYNCEPLRNAIHAEIQQTLKERGMALLAHDRMETEFLFRWKLASNFHDVGYIFEISPKSRNAAVESETLKEESLKLINDYRKNFLFNFLKQQKDEVLAQSVLAAHPFADYPQVDKVEQLFVLHTPVIEKQAFAKMQSFLPKEWRDGGLIQNYFDLCRNEDADGVKMKRPKFLDHGVMSALILLKSVDIQVYYLDALNQLAGEGKLAHESALDVVRGAGVKQHLQDINFFVRFEHVAGAIALHNVYPKLYSKITCAKYNLAKLFYATDPTKQFMMQPGQALSYLLALTDGLQDWDRHSFRKPNFDVDQDSDPLAAPEVLMVATNKGVTVVGLSPAARERYDKRFTEMAETLADLDSYVKVAASISS